MLKQTFLHLLVLTLLIPFGLDAAQEKKEVKPKTAAKEVAKKGTSKKEATKKETSKKDSAKYHFEETVHIRLPHLYLSKWEVGHQSAHKAGIAVTRYYLNTESKDNWTQLINIQFKDKAHLKGNLNVEKAMQEEAQKSSWVTSKIHSQKENDLIYIRDFPTGEHEVVRMIMTKKGLHRVAYIRRGPLSQEERTQWIERLAQGEIGGKLEESPS